MLINCHYSHYFLAQGGVNTQILIKELGTIHLGGLEEHRQPIQDTNVEGYLQQQNTETIMKIVQDGRQEVIHILHTMEEFFCNEIFRRSFQTLMIHLRKTSITTGISF